MALILDGTNGLTFPAGSTLNNGTFSTGVTAPSVTFTAANQTPLADYETGTFTPSFTGGTFTYANQTGVYTKVGTIVTIGIGIRWTANSGGTTGIQINLPFFSINNGNARFCGSLGYTAGLTFTSGYVPEVTLSGAANFVNLWVTNPAGGGPTQLLYSNLQSSGELQISITYVTA